MLTSSPPRSPSAAEPGPGCSLVSSLLISLLYTGIPSPRLAGVIRCPCQFVMRCFSFAVCAFYVIYSLLTRTGLSQCSLSVPRGCGIPRWPRRISLRSCCSGFSCECALSRICFVLFCFVLISVSLCLSRGSSRSLSRCISEGLSRFPQQTRGPLLFRKLVRLLRKITRCSLCPPPPSRSRH